MPRKRTCPEDHGYRPYGEVDNKRGRWYYNADIDHRVRLPEFGPEPLYSTQNRARMRQIHKYLREHMQRLQRLQAELVPVAVARTSTRSLPQSTRCSLRPQSHHCRLDRRGKLCCIARSWRPAAPSSSPPGCRSALARQSRLRHNLLLRRHRSWPHQHCRRHRRCRLQSQLPTSRQPRRPRLKRRRLRRRG